MSASIAKKDSFVDHFMPEIIDATRRDGPRQAYDRARDMIRRHHIASSHYEEEELAKYMVDRAFQLPDRRREQEQERRMLEHLRNLDPIFYDPKSPLDPTEPIFNRETSKRIADDLKDQLTHKDIKIPKSETKKLDTAPIEHSDIEEIEISAEADEEDRRMLIGRGRKRLQERVGKWVSEKLWTGGDFAVTIKTTEAKTTAGDAVIEAMVVLQEIPKKVEPKKKEPVRPIDSVTEKPMVWVDEDQPTPVASLWNKEKKSRAERRRQLRVQKKAEEDPVQFLRDEMARERNAQVRKAKDLPPL